MKNWQKKFLYLSIALFSFFKMEAQTSFAIIFQDSIDAFVEEFFFEKNESNQNIRTFRDSVFKEHVQFFQNRLLDFSKKHQNLYKIEEAEMQVAYLKYLEQELILIEKKSDDLFNNIENSANLILQNHILKFYEKNTAKHDLSFILNANQLPFYNKKILDLTPLLIKNLNQHKTILSQQMYFKDFTIPLIEKMHQEIKLLDYPTFKEEYNNPKGAW